MALRERLQTALDASGRSKAELARACGISRAAVTEWFTGRTTSLSAKNLRIAASFLDVSPLWLEMGVGPMKGSSAIELASRDTMRRPVTKLTLSRLAPTSPRGTPMTNDEEELVEQLVVGEPALRRVLATAPISTIRNLRVLTAQGDSMAPTFRTGDLLLVDAGVNDLRADGIYALVAHGELQVKRVQRRSSDRVMLISDNQHYLPLELELDTDVQVIGRVVLAWNARLL